jgi:hypothetical protein
LTASTAGSIDRRLPRASPTLFHSDTVSSTITMSKIEKRMEQMRRAPASVSFEDLASVCRHFFGDPVGGSGSHDVYRTPWAGDPRVNIQNRNGQAKPYQVRQVLAAVERLERERGDQQ